MSIGGFQGWRIDFASGAVNNFWSFLLPCGICQVILLPPEHCDFVLSQFLNFSKLTIQT